MEDKKKEQDLIDFMSLTFTNGKKSNPPKIVYPSASGTSTRNKKITWLENYLLQYLKFPTNPKFYSLPSTLKNLFQKPQELTENAIIYLVEVWVKNDNKQIQSNKGKYRGLIYKGFDVWCYEKDPFRFVFIQGKDPDNFYLLGAFNEKDNMNIYTDLLNNLEYSYAELKNINTFK